MAENRIPRGLAVCDPGQQEMYWDPETSTPYRWSTPKGLARACGLIPLRREDPTEPWPAAWAAEIEEAPDVR